MSKLQVGVNDLETWCNSNGAYGARLMREWAGVDEDGNTLSMCDIARANSLNRVKWHCDYDHEWFSTPSSRTRGGSLASGNCPVCSHVFSPYEVWLYLALSQIFPQTEYRRKLFASTNHPQGWEYDISIQLNKRLIVIEVSTTLRHDCRKEFDMMKANIARDNDAEYICVELVTHTDAKSNEEFLASSHLAVHLIRHDATEPLKRVLVHLLGLFGHSVSEIDFNKLDIDMQFAYSKGSEFIYTFEDWCHDNSERGEQLVKEWVGELADGTPISMCSVPPRTGRVSVKWRCKTCGHEWVTTPLARVRGHNCSSCGNAWGGRSTLADWCNIHSIVGEKLQSEWVGVRQDVTCHTYSMTEVSYGSKMLFLWRCNNGHFWFTSPSIRVRGSGCPTCAHKKGRIITPDEARKLFEAHDIPFPEPPLSL